MAVTRHRGRWTVEDRCASPYHYLPVPVPPGTAGQATPGYLPGELEPGDWLVALGLYQLPRDGVSYTVIAELTSSPNRFRPEPAAAPPAPLSERPPRRELPARPGH